MKEKEKIDKIKELESNLDRIISKEEDLLKEYLNMKEELRLLRNGEENLSKEEQDLSKEEQDLSNGEENLLNEEQMQETIHDQGMNETSKSFTYNSSLGKEIINFDEGIAQPYRQGNQNDQHRVYNQDRQYQENPNQQFQNQRQQDQWNSNQQFQNQRQQEQWNSNQQSQNQRHQDQWNSNQHSQNQLHQDQWNSNQQFQNQWHQNQWNPSQQFQNQSYQENWQQGQNNWGMGQIPLQPISKKKQSINETMLGRNIMGVVASILIFIGLISLTILIFDKITDPIKVAAIFSMSALLIGAGLFFGRRQRNPFFTSLLGCGIGSMYISIISLHVIFKYIPNYAVYLLLIIWILMVIIIAKRFDYGSIFYIICQIGVLLSLVLTFIATASPVEILMLSIYTYISLGIISYNYKKRDIQYYIGVHLNFVTLFILNWIPIDRLGSNSMILQVVTNYLNLCFFAGYLIYIMLRDGNDETVKDTWRRNALFIGAACFLFSLQPSLRGVFMHLPHSVFYGSGCVFIYLINIPAVLKDRNKTVYRPFIIISVLFLMAYTMGFFTVIGVYPASGLMAIYLPLMYLAIKKRRKLFEYLSYSVMVFGIFFMSVLGGDVFKHSSLNQILERVWIEGTYAVAAISIVIFIIYLYRNSNHPKIKEYKYILIGTLMMISIMMVYATGVKNKEVIAIVLVSIWLFLSAASGFFYPWNVEFQFFSKNMIQWESINPHRLAIQTACSTMMFMILMIELLTRDMSLPIHLLVLVAASVHTILKIRSLYYVYGQQKWVGIFFGVKLTALFLIGITSFYSLSKYPYVISILGILIAATCICIGMIKTFPALRGYGLFMTFLWVLKLVTYDIMELNSLVRVIAFILGGILCFGISMIYNQMNKKI